MLRLLKQLEFFAGPNVKIATHRRARTRILAGVLLCALLGTAICGTTGKHRHNGDDDEGDFKNLSFHFDFSWLILKGLMH